MTFLKHSTLYQSLTYTFCLFGIIVVVDFGVHGCLRARLCVCVPTDLMSYFENILDV